MFAYTIHCAYGYIAIINQIIVPSTSKISIAAKILLCRPNCSGVKARLNIILSMNGNTTMKDILDLKNNHPTYPNVIAMIIYKILHTGPNNHDGGAHDGFISCWYHAFILH